MKVNHSSAEKLRSIARYLAIKYEYPRRYGDYLLMSVEFTIDPKKRMVYNAYNALAGNHDEEEYTHKAIDNMVYSAFIFSGVEDPKTLLPFWDGGGKEIMQREIERLGMGNYV